MKRTAVIIGMDSTLTAELAQTILDILNERHPGVVFTVVGGMRDSIAFEFDDEDAQ